MRSVLGTLLLVFVIICIGAVAQAHQVNLSTARVELRPDRVVAVAVALKGSDVDRLAGTHVFDEREGLVDPAKVAAAAAPIAAYVGAHVEVTGADGTAVRGGHRRGRAPTATASSSATPFPAVTSRAISFTIQPC